jgi:NAD(P)H dehydrogenase (quinone)
MQRRIISIIHDGHHCAEKAAGLLAVALQPSAVSLSTVRSIEAENKSFADADTIIFGSYSSFGTVSSDFKRFMESTQPFWYRQPWKNKYATGFTVSECNSADKLLTLQTLALFAAYHGMNWISLGILPRYVSGQQSDGQNRSSTFTGLALQVTGSQPDPEFHTGDLLSLELFAKRLLQLNINH